MKYIVLHKFDKENEHEKTELILINVDHISAVTPMDDDNKHGTVFINSISAVDVRESLDEITMKIDKMQKDGDR